jgi:protein-disulfide isomerase
VGVVLYQWVLLEVERHAASSTHELNPEQLIAQFKATPRLEAEVGSDDPVLGPSGAPVQLIVFSDFQCAACRRFALQMDALRERFGEEIQIVFKHFPLSPACNSAVTRDLHPRACECAAMAEAAHRQGRFWPVHDALFAAGGSDPRSAVQAIAARAGLDVARLDRDLGDERVRAKVQADVDLGQRWGVDRTPTVFVSGRRASSIRLRTLARLIEHELQAAP